MTANQIVRVIPVLKVNNRNVNQRFYEETLGMKVLVEEGALLSLGDASKVEKIVLEESPSMRSRKVEGPKKLGRIVVKVAQAQEIDYLLARQPETSALYQGANGRAFEVVSPQGDTIFVHAEENLESLEPLELSLIHISTQFVGKAAQDLVVATLTGDKKVVSIEFNAAVVDPEDTETLSDMTVQAINAAIEEIDAATKKKLGAFAGKLPF